MSDINKTYIFETVLISGGTTGTTSGGTINLGPPIIALETSGNTSWVGYGELSACKIRQVITISGSTFTGLWSNGEEDLNKIWGNRYTYLYF